MTIFGSNFEIEERCKGVHCVDLGESFPTIANSNEYLLAKIGVDTAENAPLEVWGKIIQYYSFVSSRFTFCFCSAASAALAAASFAATAAVALTYHKPEL